jgi:hypothetical protein
VFADYPVKFCAIYLQLFPVFVLSTNFPIIAITLRNNLTVLGDKLKGSVLHGARARLTLSLVMQLQCMPRRIILHRIASHRTSRYVTPSHLAPTHHLASRMAPHRIASHHIA